MVLPVRVIQRFNSRKLRFHGGAGLLGCLEDPEFREYLSPDGTRLGDRIIVWRETLEATLQAAYQNTPINSAAALLRQVNKTYIGIGLADVQAFLNLQEPYQLVRRAALYKTHQTAGLATEPGKEKWHLDHFFWDISTPYAIFVKDSGAIFVHKSPDKKAASIAAAYREAVDSPAFGGGTPPVALQGDNEFSQDAVVNALREVTPGLRVTGIRAHNPHANGRVERGVRTVKRLLLEQRLRRGQNPKGVPWSQDECDSVCSLHNLQIDGKRKVDPDSAMAKNIPAVHANINQPEIKKGDRVRLYWTWEHIRKEARKDVFAKPSSIPTWSKEIFTVKGKKRGTKNGSIATRYILDFADHQIPKGKRTEFFRDELQLVPPGTVYVPSVEEPPVEKPPPEDKPVPEVPPPAVVAPAPVPRRGERARGSPAYLDAYEWGNK